MRYLVFENITCKTEIIVIDMVELILKLKSMRILSERESSVKRDRVFSSKISELTLVDG